MARGASDEISAGISWVNIVTGATVSADYIWSYNALKMPDCADYGGESVCEWTVRLSCGELRGHGENPGRAAPLTPALVRQSAQALRQGVECLIQGRVFVPGVGFGTDQRTATVTGQLDLDGPLGQARVALSGDLDVDAGNVEPEPLHPRQLLLRKFTKLIGQFHVPTTNHDLDSHDPSSIQDATS